jgi:hypothetical protein
MWMIRARETVTLSANKTTAGRVLAAIPMSTNQTSPWRGFVAIEKIKDFLLDLASGQNVSPGIFLSLTSQELQIMQDLAEDGLRLSLDFFEQNFLSTHVALCNLPARTYEVKGVPWKGGRSMQEEGTKIITQI